MAQYVSFSPNVEVMGESILSVVNALPAYKETMSKLLAKHGIIDPQPGKWYKQELWLKAFKEIGEKYGSHTLFAIGKTVFEHSEDLPGSKAINNLEDAYKFLQKGYEMSHRNGKIGYYKVTEFNAKNCFAVLEADNPYPSSFDRGLLTSLTRKFKPSNSVTVDVQVDSNQPTRLNGADSCTYRITW